MNAITLSSNTKKWTDLIQPGLKVRQLTDGTKIKKGIEKSGKFYYAHTFTKTEFFSTERAAKAWLRRMGYYPNGEKIMINGKPNPRYAKRVSVMDGFPYKAVDTAGR